MTRIRAKRRLLVHFQFWDCRFCECEMWPISCDYHCIASTQVLRSICLIFIILAISDFRFRHVEFTSIESDRHNLLQLLFSWQSDNLIKSIQPLWCRRRPHFRNQACLTIIFQAASNFRRWSFAISIVSTWAEPTTNTTWRRKVSSRR